MSLPRESKGKYTVLECILLKGSFKHAPNFCSSLCSHGEHEPCCPWRFASFFGILKAGGIGLLVNPSCSVSVQVALVFPNNDPAASMVAFYGCLLAEVVPVPIEVPLTRKVKSMLSPAGRVRLGRSGTFCGEVRMRRWLVFEWLFISAGGGPRSTEVFLSLGRLYRFSSLVSVEGTVTGCAAQRQDEAGPAFQGWGCRTPASERWWGAV